MASLTIMTGHTYALHNTSGQKMLDFEAIPGTKAGFLRFGINNRYLRIDSHGQVDMKGGGGALCDFCVELAESGLLSLIRGPFKLASHDDGKYLTSVSKDSAASAVALWAIEEKGVTEAADKSSPPMVQLCHGSLHFGPFIRKDRGDGHVLFHGLDGGYLRILAGSGSVDAKGGGGPQCQFKVDTMEGGSIRLQSTVGPRRYVGVTAWGALTGCELESSCQLFHLQAASAMHPTQLPKLVAHSDFDEGVDFTPEERLTFMQDGFIVIKNIVPKSLLDAALTHINAALLTPGSVTKDDDGTLQVCPTARGSDAVQALLYGTPLWTLVQRLLGRGRVAHRNVSQMALRAPNLNAAPLNDDNITSKQWHIDGMVKGKHSPFSLLLGVALSDQAKPNCGNLVAYRGSHHVLQPLVRREVESGTALFSGESGPAANKLALSSGQQVLLESGDAVLLHQKVAHRVGVNHTPHIRYQTYFRLSHVEHEQKVEDGSLLDDLWDEFEGLKDDVMNICNDRSALPKRMRSVPRKRPKAKRSKHSAKA